MNTREQRLSDMADEMFGVLDGHDADVNDALTVLGITVCKIVRANFPPSIQTNVLEHWCETALECVSE